MKTIGVIGLGSIGMRHAKNLLAMGHKVYGGDPDTDRVIELVASGGENEISQPYELGKLDAVVIASPTETHAHYLNHAVNANIPVLIEKPISGGRPEVIIEILDKATKPIMVGNNLRFHSCVKQTKEWMDEGLIGKPLCAAFSVSQYNNKYTDPCILNWGAHEIDLALYLLGPAKVTAAVGNHDITDICLLHDSMVGSSTVHVDYLAPIERRGFSILGTEGNIGVDLVNRVGWLKTTNAADQGVLTLPWEEGPEATVEFRIEGADCGSWDQDYKDEIKCFIDLIDGKPAPNAATGYDGLATLEIIAEARRKAGV